MPANFRHTTSIANQPANDMPGSLSRKSNIIVIVIVGFLFFVFGFVSWVNSILIPYFKIACELTNFEAYLVTFAFYISYFLMSLPSSMLLKKIGFRQSIKWGLWIMALGTFIFVPAALTRMYALFLCGLFTIGSGLAILQTTVNPYITLIGPPERAAQRISLMGIFNKGAGICAPLLFAAVILKPGDTPLFHQLQFMSEAEKQPLLAELLRRVIVPYSVVGTILLIVSFLIYYSPLPDLDTEKESSAVSVANMGKKGIWQFPHLMLGALAIFLHVGTQVIAIDTIIGYANSMHISLIEAKVFPSYTLFATICGYILGVICIPRFISQLQALRLFTVSGLIFTFFILFARGNVHLLNHSADVSIWFLVLLGLSNSLVWAGIWPLALDGLGRFTKIGSSVLIMGLCGNAILPLIYGYLADLYSTRQAYWVLVPCYLYIIFYAFIGYRVRSWSHSKKSNPEIGHR